MKKLLLSDQILSGRPGEGAFSGYLLIEGERLVDVRRELPAPDLIETCELHDYRGHLLCPGFVDAHTHLIFGGDRAHELALKLQGASYMEIHEQGGGILATVEATRRSSAEDLYRKTYKRLDLMLLHGTTTVEAKSGYGLSTESELKCLQVLRDLKQAHPLDMAITFMAAHATPPEYKGRSEDYIRLILEEMLPRVCQENLAEFFDIFCEPGIFDLEQTERMAETARKAGLALKIHADELEHMGGAGLAARLGAVSTEHLMAISDEDIEALAASQTVACLLPSTSFYLMVKNYAPARKMLERGVKVAVASDFNPGSSPSLNLQTAMNHAVFGMKMTPLEVFTAVTYRAAEAIGRQADLGSLEVGKLADVLVLDVATPVHFFYDFGRNHVQSVYKRGHLLVDQGQILPRA